MSDTPENIRPWGRYDILDTGTGFQVKRIRVLKGERLSYQRHQKRSEVWVIVQGEARITLDDVDTEHKKGDVIQIPIQIKHRVMNCGEEELVFIETQLGDYLGEDDIERFSDDYGRCKTA